MVPLPFPGSDLAHDAGVGLGVAAALAVFAAEARRRGVADDRLWAVVGCALAFGALGARLGTWAQHADLARNAGLLQWWIDGNRSILSGLVGAWLGVHVGKRIVGYRARTGDLFAPAVALGMAVGRVGCLLTELPGTPTGVRWGMVLDAAASGRLGGPRAGAVAGVGLHPSFAYEIAFHAVAFAVLWRLRDRLARPGDLFVLYMAGYAVFRFCVEFVRGNAVAWGGLTRPQLFLAVTMPLLAWRVARLVRDARGVGRVPEPVG